MIKINQTIFNKNGNCYSACIASILEIPIKDVPAFSYNNGKSSFINANDWIMTNFNMYLLSSDINNFDKENLQIIKKFKIYHLILGLSATYNTYHCCVGLNGDVVHDPHPKQLGLNKISRYEFIIPLDLKNRRK